MSEYLELTNWTLTKELLEKIRNTKGNNCVTMPLDLFEDMIENLEEQQAEIQAPESKADAVKASIKELPRGEE